MRALKTALCFVVVMMFAPIAVAQDDEGFERQLELARQIQELRPAREQVENAIDRYVARMSENRREVFRSALRNVFNYKALEKISIDAYAETYTEAELQAMLEYYSKPEARSASEKADEYARKVYPEIVRMLDRAAMRVRTGAPGGP